MRLTVLILASLAVTVAATSGALGAGAEFRAGLPAYFAVRTPVAPVIDGRLDDACWRAAPVADDFRGFPLGTAAQSRTQFQVAWDDHALYLAVTAFGDYSQGAQVSARERDGPVWGDDSVEIFLDPGRTESAYFHLAVNAANVQADERAPDGGLAWNGQWQSAVQVAADRFTVEIAVPWTTLGTRPDPTAVWGLGVDRNQPQGDRTVYSGWSPGVEGFHTPHNNGYLLFGTTNQHLQSLAARVQAELQEKTAGLSAAAWATAPAAARAQIQAARAAVAEAQAAAAGPAPVPLPRWAALARRLSQATGAVDQAVWTVKLWALLLSPD